MRLAKEIYWSFQEKIGAYNISNIKIPIDGKYYDLADLPSSYIEEEFGYTKEDLYNMIIQKVTLEDLKENMDDL